MTEVNPPKMPESVRIEIVEIARKLGWCPVATSTGKDAYKKLLTLRKGDVTICIDRDIGFSRAGVMKQLKVVMHPKQFLPGLAKAGSTIREYINRDTKINWHKHSGYQQFDHSGEGEPAGMGYAVKDLVAMETLLVSLC